MESHGCLEKARWEPGLLILESSTLLLWVSLLHCVLEPQLQRDLHFRLIAVKPELLASTHMTDEGKERVTEEHMNRETQRAKH